MQSGRKLLTLLLIYASFGFSCADEKKPAVPLKLFPAGEACIYPGRATTTRFHYFAVGTWQKSPSEDPLEYFCGKEAGSLLLYNDGEGIVSVEYAPAGIEAGASMISINYTATAAYRVTNEATFRTVFARFVEEMTQQALGSRPPELIGKMIGNLNSYAKAGTDSYESFDVGEGFVQLHRSRDPSNIVVRTKIFPDKASKIQ
jgi:hypothetical protein